MARDIHELEVEFAKNPTPDACMPLCEAYLAQKRFMEAMVVCKKGIKNAPTDVRGPIMLARIYLEQGKAPKAEQELAASLPKFPNHPLMLEMQGRIAAEQGRRDEGIRYLHQALSIDPNLVNAKAMLQQMGAPLPSAAPPPQAAPQAPAGAPPPRPGPPQAGPPPVQAGGPPQRTAPPQQMPQTPSQAARAPQQMAATPSQAGAPAPRPMGATNTPTSTSTASGKDKALEHVGDFFAPDTLGFANDSSIETAGPGRLTILGFVPKSTGSIKTTVGVMLVVLAVAGAWMGYQYVKSQNERKLASVIRDVRASIDQDSFVAYKSATQRGEEALKVDDDSVIALSTLAYAHAVLAVDHQVEESAAKAKEILERADKAGGDESAYRVAAHALMAYYDKQYDVGVSGVKKMQDKNVSDPKIEVEAFRLLLASRPADKETQIEERRLQGVSAGSVRAQNFLGWYYYMRDNWERADASFAGALQSNRAQPQALIGKALVDLDRGIGLKERQVEVEGNLKRVFAQEDELSKPTQALAYFARSQLYQFQQKSAEADVDFKKAQQLDPTNPIFDYRRGVTLLGLQRNADALASLKAAASKAPNDPRYFKRLAEAQSAMGDSAAAKASLDRAAQLAPNDFEVKLLEGQRLAKAKQFDPAIAVYDTINKDLGAEAYARAQIAKAQAYIDSGRAPKAAQTMEGFLEAVPAGTTKPLLAQTWCQLGLAHESNRNHDAAMSAYQTGTEQFQYEPMCHWYMCRAGAGKSECDLYTTLAPNGEHVAEAKRKSAASGGE